MLGAVVASCSPRSANTQLNSIIRGSDILCCLLTFIKDFALAVQTHLHIVQSMISSLKSSKIKELDV